ncbi:hypothetical protein [Holophaga foetida]|uniref:hypothetical protein n=1 Tax=Holophaga foetida TaxID=35839 RepID=UPI0002472F4D|nr:hypothetical protein [Holophaga foetida]
MIRSSGGPVVWVEPSRLQAGGQTKAPGGVPTEDHLAQVLAPLPAGPTRWIVDDLWAPSLFLQDVVELPKGTEAREAFFQWRYTQGLGLEGPQAVQALAIGSAWLLVGIPQSLVEPWTQVAAKLARPIFAMVPRWLWLYNRLAPSQETPGMLLSLAPAESGTFTGSLVAWGGTLSLIRQWHEPADANTWMQERVLPTLAYLQREGSMPHGLWIWGSSTWPSGPVPHHILPPEIPAQEAF